jgi:hypothetical protein
LEIKLDYKTWERVVKIAGKRKVSYSWVVRYVLFRLIKCKSNNIPDIIRNTSMEKIHRHKMCLYGKDELLIRMTAALWGCSMTRLVQIALIRNLWRLECETEGKFHRISFYWLGIKMYNGVKIHNKTPGNIYLQLTPFPKSAYW